MNNELELLVREPAPMPAILEFPADLSRMSMPTDASDEYGYMLRQGDLRRIRESVEEAKNRRHVAEVLTELNLNPYSSESVEEYQQTRLKKVRGKSGQLRNFAIFAAAAIVFVGSFVIVGSLFLVVASGHHSMTFPWAKTSLALSASITTLAFICGLLVSMKDDWKWCRIPFDQACKTSVEQAEFAMETARKVARRLPNARFFIEGLFRETEGSEPFLVLHVGGDDHYLEIWGERKIQQSNAS